MHALEIGSKGQVAFASRQTPPWHLLGTVFDGDLTTAEMLSTAYLSGWDVRLESVSDLANMIGDYRFVEDKFMVLRTNPFDQGTDTLGFVGGRYKVVQNEDLFGFGDDLLAGGGRWETAGSIKQGRVVFGSLRIDRQVVVGAGEADDKTEMYLVIMTSHDGTTAVQAFITPVRVVCQNTLNLALSQVKQSFKMRHTQTIEGRMAVAREALGLTFKYADAFEAEANMLFETACTKQQFDKLIEQIYPRPTEDVKGSVKKWEDKRDILMGIYTDTGDGPKTTGATFGTAWGAMNALTEQLDYYRKARGGNVENLYVAASGFDPVITARKNEIRRAVLTLAA